MSDATSIPARNKYTPAVLLDENGAGRFSLGGNIRSTRILRGLKLRELAEQVGCSESMVSKIENGKTTPSLGLLHKIAQSFRTTVPALLSPRDDAHIVSRSGERICIQIDRVGSHVERLVAADGKHMLEGHLHVLAPGGGSEGAVAHEGEEVGYIVAGELQLTVGHEVFLLREGDSFSFRSEIEHHYKNVGKKTARVVWVSTPGRDPASPQSFAGRSKARSKK